MNDEELILTPKELAHYLRLNQQTIYRMVARGDIPVIRIGRTVRFRKAVIDDWLNAKTEGKEKPTTKKKGSTR
jgi:excisionase family DNA binding protein